MWRSKRRRRRSDNGRSGKAGEVIGGGGQGKAIAAVCAGVLLGLTLT
jgi:hypothetical protein